MYPSGHLNCSILGINYVKLEEMNIKSDAETNIRTQKYKRKHLYKKYLRESNIKNEKTSK